MTTDDLIAVMVPRKHLSQVYGLIARLDGGDAHGVATPVAPHPTPAPTSQENGASPPSDEWNSAQLRRMLKQSPPAMKDLLVAMAQHPDQWLTTRQLADAIQNNADADWKTVAGTMGAFGRRVKNRYQVKSFPFEKRYDHDAQSQVYRMSSAMSARILQALQEI